MKPVLTLLLVVITLSGCSSLVDTPRTTASAQPRRYEVPLAQLPQSVDPEYALDYSISELWPQEDKTTSPQPVEPLLAAQSPSGDQILEGIPVVGQPNLMQSPHAPQNGFIDIQGFPPGTEIKDPYSGRTLIVPQPVDPPPKTDKNTSPLLKPAPKINIPQPQDQEFPIDPTQTDVVDPVGAIDPLATQEPPQP